MAINKIAYGNTTLIDLTSDTVTASTLASGQTAHDRSGTVITGSAILKSNSEVIGSTLYLYDTDLYSVSGTTLMFGNKVNNTTLNIDF